MMPYTARATRIGASSKWRGIIDYEGWIGIDGFSGFEKHIKREHAVVYSKTFRKKRDALAFVEKMAEELNANPQL